MIGRSFAAEDAHDKIRAYVIDLFEVIDCEAEEDLEQVRRYGGPTLLLSPPSEPLRFFDETHGLVETVNSQLLSRIVQHYAVYTTCENSPHCRTKRESRRLLDGLRQPTRHPLRQNLTFGARRCASQPFRRK